jgi:hypothetical protein
VNLPQPILTFLHLPVINSVSNITIASSKIIVEKIIFFKKITFNICEPETKLQFQFCASQLMLIVSVIAIATLENRLERYYPVTFRKLNS